MRSHTIKALFLLNIAAVVTATPYFAFYNDDACTQGQGISVSGDNDGCLQESGRLSFGPSGGTADFYNPVLVAYSDANCANEIGCNALGLGNGSPECYAFNGDPESTYFGFANGAQSFKFISGSPGECPGGCAGPTNGQC
jgi:hypothetical protein